MAAPNAFAQRSSAYVDVEALVADLTEVPAA